MAASMACQSSAQIWCSNSTLDNIRGHKDHQVSFWKSRSGFRRVMAFPELVNYGRPKAEALQQSLAAPHVLHAR
jgi:hypothetical protein